MAEDPVCGRAASKSEYRGETYSFYSPSCRQSFDQNPAKYTGQSQPAPHDGGHH